MRTRLLVVIVGSVLAATLAAPMAAEATGGTRGPVHPSAALGHQDFTVTGTVPPRGRPVLLQQRTSKERWRTVARTHARRGGTYSLRTGHQLAACRYVDLRVVAPAYAGHRKYVRSFTQRVIAAKATILVPAAVRPAEPFTVDGLLVPAAVRPVALQRRDADGWVTVATSRSSKIGEVTFGGVTIPGATAELRLSAPATRALPLTRSRPAPVVAHDATPTPTTTVERLPGAVQPDGASYNPRISADGRYVAYQSLATNLPDGGGTADEPEIFLTDRSSGTTTRVTRTPSHRDTLDAISPDGRFLAFSSNAPTLVPRDANHMVPDVFVYDRTDASVSLESRATNGTQSNDFSDSAQFVGSSGRYVAFRSDATNLTPQHRAGLFLRDRRNGTTTLLRAGHRVPGTAGLAPMVGGPASADACDTNRGDDAQVTTFPGVDVQRVSPDAVGVVDDDTGEGLFSARSAVMSSNSRYVAYVFGAASGHVGDVLISDRQTHVTRRLPVDADSSTLVAISADGRYVAIAGAPDALGQESDAVQVSDWQNGQLWTVAAPSADGWSYGGGSVAFSSGNELVFSSANPDLVPGDTNGVTDVFVARLG